MYVIGTDNNNNNINNDRRNSNTNVQVNERMQTMRIPHAEQEGQEESTAVSSR